MGKRAWENISGLNKANDNIVLSNLLSNSIEAVVASHGFSQLHPQDKREEFQHVSTDWFLVFVHQLPGGGSLEI